MVEKIDSKRSVWKWALLAAALLTAAAVTIGGWSAHAAAGLFALAAVAVGGYGLVMRDRGELTQTREEAVRFEAVLAAMHDALFETDWQGIREVNESFCRMTGFAREELLGARAPYPFWPAEEYARIAAALETSMRGQARDFELVLTRKNGERFPVLLSVSRILEHGGVVKTHVGKANRVLYSFRDISELKRAEELVREGERRFRTLFEANLIGIVMSDGAVVTDANDTFLKTMRFSRADVDARKITRAQMIAPEQQASHQARLDRLLVGENQGLSPTEYELIRGDGTRVPVIAGSVLVQRDPLSWMGFTIDISAQKEQARELAAAKDRAETEHRANEALLDLLNRELRTPMTPILSLASAMQGDPRLPAELRDEMAIIERNAREAKRLIDQAMRLSHGAVTVPAPPPAPAGESGSGARVLLVEDHIDTARVMTNLLRRRGFDVRCVGTAAQGVEAGCQGFDVLICDLGLPDGSGYDVLRSLQGREQDGKDGHGRGLPAIAFSGYATDGDIERSRAAGFAEHLTKPVDVEALIAAVDRLVARG